MLLEIAVLVHQWELLITYCKCTYCQIPAKYLERRWWDILDKIELCSCCAMAHVKVLEDWIISKVKLRPIWLFKRSNLDVGEGL